VSRRRRARHLCNAVSAQTAVPDFSASDTGWTGMGGMTAMPGTPVPVGQDPSRPLIGNIGRQPGQQPTFPYADSPTPISRRLRARV